MYSCPNEKWKGLGDSWKKKMTWLDSTSHLSSNTGPENSPIRTSAKLFKRSTSPERTRYLYFSPFLYFASALFWTVQNNTAFRFLILRRMQLEIIDFFFHGRVEFFVLVAATNLRTSAHIFLYAFAGQFYVAYRSPVALHLTCLDINLSCIDGYDCEKASCRPVHSNPGKTT